MGIFIAKAIVAPAGGATVPLTYGPDPVTGFAYSCDPSSPNLYFTDVSRVRPVLQARPLPLGEGDHRRMPGKPVLPDD